MLPAEVRPQLDALARGFEDALGDALAGVYVHGSLALGCFNSQRSDVDVIALIDRPTTADERRSLAPVMLGASGRKDRPRRPPYPLELDALISTDLRPWRYPPRFHLHWSENRRAELESSIWLMDAESADLAAHVTILRSAGVVLAGRPPDEVFPAVPDSDFADSLRRDLQWCREQNWKLYSVLSASRIWRTLTEGGVQSKVTGAEWALERAPAEFRPLIERALAVYCGELEDAELDPDEANLYVDWVAAELRSSAVS